MTAPAVSFDEWLTDHLDELVSAFHLETHGEDCVWLFLQYARSRYLTYLYGIACAHDEITPEPEAA